MSKTITISDELDKKIVDFCNDELNYHINESRFADEYEDETTAQIELLRLLGYKEMADKYESDFKSKMEEGDEEDYEEDYDSSGDEEEKDILDMDISPEELKNSKNKIKGDFCCYANGHSAYMVCGITDEDTFEDYIARVNLKLTPIGGYEFDKATKTAQFDTCEKYGPELTQRISKAFPEVTTYGTDQWYDSSYIEAYNSGGIDTPLGSVADFELDECFEDGTGNLRIDVAVIDKATGSKVTIGDLICFDDWEDVENIEGDDSYIFLTSLVGNDSRIEEAVEECRKYFANNMKP